MLKTHFDVVFLTFTCTPSFLSEKDIALEQRCQTAERIPQKVKPVTLLVQIPHPTLEKVKFPSPRNALRVKFPTPRAQVMVKCQVFARGRGNLKF